MTRGRKAGLAAVALAAGLTTGLTACEQNSLTGGGGFKDVKSVKPQDADQYTLLNNVDGFPNIVVLCYKGVSFSTTTREAAGTMLRVPELDRTCPGYVAPAR